MTTPIQKVTIIGAHGNLGSVILTSLLEANTQATPNTQFTITALIRSPSPSSSNSNPKPLPPGVTPLQIPDGFPLPDLTSALRSQDAVVVCFPLADVDAHLRIAEASHAAGVRRVIPADFGSVDSRGSYARELVRIFDRKVKVREFLEGLSSSSLPLFPGEREGEEEPRNDFGFTSLVTGHFYDWGLRNGFLHFWPDEKRAEILGDGERRSSLSTLRRVGEAVVGILQADEETYRTQMKGRVLMVQSFCVSQNEVLTVLERVTGQKWDVRYEDLEGFIKWHKELADGGRKESIEDLVFALGVVDGNWEEKEDFAMGLFGFADEDLETETKRALGMF